MKNADVIKMFLQGETKGRVNNLRIQGNKLINYDTTIAEYVPNALIVNATRYTNTTSKIQSKLINMLGEQNYIKVNNIEIDTIDLYDAYKAKYQVG